MHANGRMQTESFVKATHPRQPPKKFVNVQINTDPWFPECQKCIERDRNSSSTWGNELINVNEYVRAIQYINSIHNIINGALLKEAQSKDEAVNFLSKFSMPDLPNFLALLSNLNTNQNSGENLEKVVSKTTSTSTLSNMEPLCDDKDYDMEKTDSDHQMYETGFGDHDQPNKQEIVLQSALVKTCLPDHHFMRNLTTESTIDSDSSGSNEATAYFFPRPEEDKSYSPRIIEKNYKVIDLAGSTHKLIYPKEDSFNPKQRVAKNEDSMYEKTRCVGDRFRTNPPQIVNRESSQQTCHDWKVYRPNRVNTKANQHKHKEQTLSDAELDRYATELLYGGGSSPPSAVRLQGDHSRAKSPRSSGSTTAMLKKNLAQNIKEVATKCLEKQAARNATPRNRSKSRASSQSKNTASREKLGDIRKPSRLNSSTTIININNKCQPRKKSPTTTRSTMECTKREAGTKQEPAITLPRKPLVVNIADATLRATASSTLTLPAQKFVILPQTNPVKGRANTTLKKSPTWVVQQKDYDDFVCQVKKTTSRASGTAIMVTKEDIQRNSRVPSTANWDASTIKGKEYNKQYHVHSNKRNGWCNESQPQGSELTLKEPSSAIPLKTNIRNLPFRQPRRQCIEQGDVVSLRAAHERKNCIHSDTASNLSQSSYSSDIKSDRAPSPVYRS